MATATDYGVDVSTYPDLDITFQPMTGARAVAEALARRFETPRGSLIYDPNYGTDLRAWLNESFDVAGGELDALANAIESEALKDERVSSVDVKITLNQQTNELTVLIRGEGAEGPFEMTMNVSRVTVSLLEVTP